MIDSNIDNETDNVVNKSRIKVDIKDVYIKPIYTSTETYKHDGDDHVVFYQKFYKPLNYIEERRNYVFIEDGFTKCSIVLNDKCITIEMFLSIYVKLPKMLYKIIGAFLMECLFKNIDSCVV